jgi:serine/threonine-protein kinase
VPAPRPSAPIAAKPPGSKPDAAAPGPKPAPKSEAALAFASTVQSEGPLVPEAAAPKTEAQVHVEAPAPEAPPAAAAPAVSPNPSPLPVAPAASTGSVPIVGAVPPAASTGPVPIVNAPAAAPIAAASSAASTGPVAAITTPDARVSNPGRAPMLSDPEMRGLVEHIGRTVGNRVDPEQSLEIPPPARLDPVGEDGEAKDPYIGTTFDHRYKIEELLGEGGMGFVYRARHKVIDKKIAIKVLRADLARDKEITERFRQEAKAASSIGNPHIIDISDFGDLPDGSTYFVMEFLDGKSLASIIDSKQQLSIERICHVATQIADGLAAAHASGIVHRDLKPDNIFLITRGADKDFVKILDFGIAKVTNEGGDKLTKAGAVFGTPHYMSPEQAAGAPIDHRTDIYSLGVIMYEMTSGQLPFNADNFMGILTQHMYKAPVPIRALVPVPDRPTTECPPTLEAVILKCMSKKPEQRYQSMDELRADLEKVRDGAVPAAVGEMMARSGGFNVPADYFKQPATALVPATPKAAQNKWPRIVWVAGALAAVGLVAGIFAIAGSGSGATNPSGTTGATTSAPTEVVSAPPTTQPSATQSAAAVPPKMITVLLDSDPSKGTATYGGKTINLPDIIQVEEGKTVSVEIKRAGFEPVTVEIDGKKSKETIKLKALKGGASVKPTNTSTGTPGVVDPWATKPKKK